MASGAEQTMLANVLQDLADEARSHRSKMPFDSRERQFYLGVEAAAEAVHHPQTYDAKPAAWMEHESHAFRNGFLTTSAQIAGILSGSRIPLRLELPMLGSPGRHPQGGC